MRAVLIVMGEASAPEPGVARSDGGGRPLALRQLDFALACGCEKVLVLDFAGSREFAMLRRAARKRSVVLQVVDGTHGLLGLLGATDELLVLAADLLPESEGAVEALTAGAGVLVLPADTAISAGFERIDYHRAWAGATLIPGALVERLAELPPDSDAPATLLRIALQAHVLDRRLPDTVLTDGSWLMAHGGAVPILADGWRRQQLDRAEPWNLTGRLAQALLSRWPAHLAPRLRIIASLYAGSAALLVGATALAWHEYPAPGLALLAPSALAAALAELLARIGAGPFARGRQRWRPQRVLSLALDAALAACGALAIGGAWLGRLFPPLMLLLALHAHAPAERPRAVAMLEDRMVLALVMATAAALGLAEPALMLLALTFFLSDRFHTRPG